MSLKIMVSSTVYGSETDLDQIEAILKGYGYHVIMSKNGSVYVPTGVSNEEACLQAVEDCDLFLGIVFPRYGSGITHSEFKKAIELDKPRWFISHHYVVFAREILKQYMYLENGNTNPNFRFSGTNLMDSADVIDLYNDAIQNKIPFVERRSNWAQPFFKISEAFTFLETQFADIDRRKKELTALSQM